MLTIHRNDDRGPETWRGGDIPADAVWLDLCDASDSERQAVEQRLGTPLPGPERFEGVSRNRLGDDGALRLRLPHFDDDEKSQGGALDLLLTAELLLTRHRSTSRELELAATEFQREGRPHGGDSALTILFDVLADRTAERMQSIAGDLADLSDAVFVPQRLGTRALRRMLLRVGHLEGRLARSRAGLLGIGRAVAFVCERKPDWMAQPALQRLHGAASDLETLDQFDEQLTDKLQFLQDAILGFINTDQNEVMKLLTVVSVATVPPILLAAIWGMNFHHMPELSWPWAYPVALLVIVLSMLLPLLWFRWRGWLGGD
jgi:magnesium transporter